MITDCTIIGYTVDGEWSGSSNQEPEKRKSTWSGEDNIAAEMVHAGGMCSLEVIHGLC